MPVFNQSKLNKLRMIGRSILQYLSLKLIVQRVNKRFLSSENILRLLEFMLSFGQLALLSSAFYDLANAPAAFVLPHLALEFMFLMNQKFPS